MECQYRMVSFGYGKTSVSISVSKGESFTKHQHARKGFRVGFLPTPLLIINTNRLEFIM